MPVPGKTAPKPDNSAKPQTKKGGLEKAIAETTSDRRVIVTQDKKDADGNVETPKCIASALPIW